MNDQSFLTMTGANLEATAAQAAMANCVMHLFKQGFNPTPQTPLADFLTNEADYDGYAPITIAAWGAPVLAGLAWAIYAPTQTFRYVDAGDSVANMIAGYFLVTAGGVLKSYTVFGSAVPMATNGQAVIKTPIEVYTAG